MNLILFQKDGIALRTHTLEDAPLLLRWLTDPAVLEWYEGRDNLYDAERIKEDFYEESENETKGLIMYEERAIGYIQFYLLEDEEREDYGYAESPDRIYGMDQFIGETDCWNQGIGTRVIAAVADYLFEEGGTYKLVMDPQVRNERALRVYEKNGFVRVKRMERREMHEGELRDCWLIEKNRPQAQQSSREHPS
ncbi:GNAT family N-acetyltransferase [Saccharibacillus qingshengii]|uniref:GNAT family N-acetyltransferase n=1 Tax=Saccharibacillus qingshengii TaxID=1763540 RepID=UPI001552C68F|nr:GNAT family N-acetyltransferase [Saccharibacillus qingshengii]